MDSDKVLREQLVKLLQGGMAHMTFDEAVADFPMDAINRKPPNVAYTPWHILEHLRFTQKDILDFMINPRYQEPKWPDDYWPAKDRHATPADWQETINAFRSDMKAIQALATDPNTDLYARIPHGTGQIILREILLVVDHNAYHIGEFGVLRQVMKTWPPDHE